MLLRFTLPVALCFVATPALLLGACTSDSTTTAPSTTPAPSSTAEPSPDDTSPEPTQPTAYTEAELQKILNVRCVRCHDSTSANVDLSAPFTKDTVGVPVGGASGGTVCGRTSDLKVRIQPGDREASLLWHKVKGTQDCGSPMPYDKRSDVFDEAELERLGLYIDGLAK